MWPRFRGGVLKSQPPSLAKACYKGSQDLKARKQTPTLHKSSCAYLKITIFATSSPSCLSYSLTFTLCWLTYLLGMYYRYLYQWEGLEQKSEFLGLDLDAIAGQRFTTWKTESAFSTSITSIVNRKKRVSGCLVFTGVVPTSLCYWYLTSKFKPQYPAFFLSSTTGY